MATNPNLLAINPYTKQPYTPSELADLALKQVNSKYAESAYGESIVRTPAEIVSNVDNTYFDYMSSGYQIGTDNQEARAQLQPWYEQLGRSVAKMGVVAGTTALDGTIGILAGIANMANGSQDGNLLNKFIDNPFSNYMLELQKKAEQAMPNYYTQQELDNAWYENLGTANFWGDNIIKNMGFAIGAVGSGMVASGIASRVLGMSKLTKTSDTLRALTKAVQEGKQLSPAQTAAMRSLGPEDLAKLKNGEVLTELGNVAKSIKSKTAITQATSSFMGAVGEARIEALQNTNEFREAKVAELDAALSAGDISYEEYQARKDKIDSDVLGMQNGMFVSNLVLLSLSNYAQFKNVFSNGYTPNKVISNEVATLNKKTNLYELATRGKLAKTVDTLALLKNPLSEMLEEQGQYAIQKGVEHYTELKNDPKANSTIQNFMLATGQGLKEAFGTEDGWENAVSGLIIGSTGIPTIGRKSNGKIGLTMAGGIRGDYVAQKQADANYKAATERVNTLLQQNVTRKLYDTMVTDTALQSIKDQSIVENDRMNAKTINSMQLANLVDSFVEMDKFDDFITLIQDENELSAVELKDKYNYKTTSPTTGTDVTFQYFRGMDDNEIKDYIKNKSEKAITQAKALRKIKEDIDTRFVNHSADAKKDLFLKAAAVQDIDDRLATLLNEIKLETGESFFRAINKNFTPEMLQYISDFSALTTPVDLEQFLEKRSGLENYERLIKEYLDYQTDSAKALKFAEKARDLYGLVKKRQIMNDLYFAMADEEYARNADAINAANKRDDDMTKNAEDRRFAEFKKGNVVNDPELGFTSNIFEVDAGKKDVLSVKATDDKGDVTTYTDVRPVQTDGDGNTVFRTDKNGNKYADYVGINEKGEEVVFKNIKNPVEEKKVEDNKVRLRFSEEDANTLYDESGNVYTLDELEQDPAFLNAKVVTVEEQKLKIINEVREKTLKSLIKTNAAHTQLLQEQIVNLEASIKEAEDLLVKAKANKTQRAAGRLDGIKGVFTVFNLENKLAKHRENLEKLKEERATLFEANNKALGGIKEVQQKNFSREAFNKAIEEDVAILNKQLARLQDSADQAEATAERLQEVVDALKAAIRVIYPKFRKLYQELYGVDPAELNKTGNLTLRGVDPILKKLRADELALYSQLRVEEAALNDMLQKLADINQYLNNNKNMVATLKGEQQLLEGELARVFAAIRASKTKVQSKVEAAPAKALEVQQETTEKTEAEASQFVSAKRSVDDTMATAGRHYQDDDTLNPNVDQQRWFKTIAKINLAAGQFVLRVFTPKERPDLFANVPDELKEDAIAVVLYNKGNPVDSNLQPLEENAPANELVYSFLPRVVTDTKRLEQMFYDANKKPEQVLAEQEALKALRQTLQQRAEEGKKSFLEITDKSVGLIDTTGQRRNPDNDLTTSVWDTLLGNGDDKSKMDNLDKSSIQVGVAKNEAEQEAGIAYIAVGGKLVKVRNGLTYFVNEQTGVVVPLLGRKLTGNEVNVVMDMLSARADGIVELATTEEDAEALKAAASAPVEPETDEKKKKKKGTKATKDKKKRVFQRTNRNAVNPFTKKKVTWNKSQKAYGFYAYKTEVSKEKAEEVKKKKTVDKLPAILQYISDLIYFGKQTKKDGSLIISNPNPQTEIFLDGWNPATNNYDTLTYFDFDKNTVVTIPFTSKSIQDNRVSLEKFLANKYLQVRKSKIGEKGHLEALEIVFADGKPSFVRVHKHSNYTNYLVSNKRGAEKRPTEEIPLTTNARTTAGEVTVKSTYLKFPKEPERIKDNPLGGKVTPKKVTPAPTNPLEAKAKELMDAFQLAINKRDFAVETLRSLMVKLQTELGGKLSEIQEEFKRLAAEDVAVDEALYDSLDDAAKSQYVNMVVMQQAISNVIMPAAATASTATPDTSAPSAPTSSTGDDTSAGESPELATLLATSEETEGSVGDAESDEYDGIDLDEEYRTQTTGAPQINIDNAKAWLAKNLPQVPLKIRDKIANGLAQGKVDINGVLHLSNFAEEGTEYHEALHSVMLGILSDKELKEVYDEAKKIYGEPTEQDLADLKKIYPNKSKAVLTRIFYDEKLAEDFRTFALSGGKEYPSKKLKTVFEEILDFIKAILGIQDPVTQVRTSVVDTMFHKLYTGQYAEATYDTSKVKERLQNSGSLFRPMNIPNTKLIAQGLVTKEVVNAVLYNFFKALRVNNSTMEDFTKTLNTEVYDPTTGKYSKPNLNLYLYQAIRDTIKAINSLPVEYKEKAQKELLPLLKDPSKGGLVVNSKSFRDTEVLRVVKEYIQNDLGVDLGLYKEESLNDETDTLDRDSNAWAKDPTTTNPREGANAYVKLMLASIQDTVRNEDGNIVPSVGRYGLPMLVNPNSLFNHLIQLLHNARSYDEMVEILKANEDNLNGTPKFPYLKAVREMLEDSERLKADPFGAALLKLNFQQAMYKATLNYKSWLINEDNVVVVDPNSESLDQRIKESWRQGFVDNLGAPGSIVVKDKDTKIPVIKKASVQAIIKNVTSRGIKPETFDYYVEVLNGLGFTMTATDEYSPAERDVLLVNGGYLVSVLTKGDTELDYLFNKTEQGRIEALARIEAERNPQKTDYQHIGPDGKTRYGITEHNMISTLTEFINGMKKGASIKDLFTAFPTLDSAYSENSYLFKEVLFKDGRRTSAPFKINVIEGSRINKPGEEGEINTKLTKADRAWISMNSMLKGVFPILRTSDKSLEYAIETEVPFPISKIGQSASEYVDTFVGYLKDELNVGKSQDVLTVKNFKKNIGSGVYFFEKILEGKVRNIGLNENVDSYITENRDAIEEAILDYLEQHDAKVIEALKNLDILETTGELYRLNAFDRALSENIGSTNYLDADQLDNIVRAVTVNSLVMNLEQTKLFFGHPAFYKSTVDLYKRTAGAVGTKVTGIVDDHINAFLASIPALPKDGKLKKEGEFKTIVLEEPVTDSSYYDEIYEAFEKEYGAEKAALLANKYKNIEEADGQGYITLPEYREFMIRTGQGWSREMEDIYNDVMQDKYVPISAISKVFNPLKAQYFGLYKLGNTSFPVYLKFSLLPLIPSVYKGTNMETIAESMMANGQGVAVYPSGIKLGALMQDTNNNFLDAYDENGVVNPIPNSANTLILDYRFMGIQVKTGDKIKQETTRGSQQAKLILSNIYENGVSKQISVVEDGTPRQLSVEETAYLVKDYHKTVAKITAAKTQKLLKEIGAEEQSPGVYKIKNIAKLTKTLRDAARRRNSPDNLIDAFDIKSDGTTIELKHLLDTAPGRNKIENILFSMINNELISQKYHGGGRIQAASTLFERSPRTRHEESGDIVGNLTSNPDLKFYRKGKYGETLPAQVKLSPNKEQIELIKKLGGLERTNAILKELFSINDENRYDPSKVLSKYNVDIDSDIFRFIAYRIPTQGVNTIEHMEIVEFLDPSNGEAIQLPSEIVAKSGGDYDIDKLNVYFKHFTKDGKLVEGEDLEGLHNKLIDLNQTFLSSPEYYTELLIPNMPVTIQALAEDMARINETKGVNKTDSLTWLYNLEVAENYLVGKAAVGIVARHITHHTFAQQTNLQVNEVYLNDKGDQVPSNLNFAGSENNYSLAGEKDVEGKNKINHIISEFLSAFVDIGKDPFVVDIGGSTKTADLYMYLLRRGVPIDQLVYFMNQPVIKEYYKRLATATAMFKEGKTSLTGERLTLRRKEIVSNLIKDLESSFSRVGGTLSAITPKVFTTDTLYNHLGKPFNSPEISFIRDQYNILNDFLRYSEQADNLRVLMDATAQDTTRVKNFNALDNMATRMYKVIKSGMFTGEDIFEKTFLGAFKKAQETASVFRDLFVTEHPNVAPMLEGLRGYLLVNGVNEEDMNTIMDKAKNDVIVQAVSAYYKVGSNGYQKELFMGENSMAKRIATTLRSPSPAIRNSPFYKNIYPLVANLKANVEGLKMFNTKLSTFDFNQLVNAFRSIKAKGAKYEVINKDKRDLAFFALLQSGLDNSPITWYDKVPIEISSAIITPALLNYAKMESSQELQSFVHQFIRNNYSNSQLVPYVGSYRTDGKGVHIDSTGTMSLPSWQAARYANVAYVKVDARYPEYNVDQHTYEKDRAAGVPTSEMLLFAKVGDNKYKLVNKLGDKMYMKEYNSFVNTSMLPANNVAEGVFAKQFPNWSEPNLPDLPTDSGFDAYREACN